MNNKPFLLLTIILLLTGCAGPSDKVIGQSVLSATPIVFLVSIGFQYLFFRIWKRKWPELKMSLLPNLIFFIVLLLIAFLFRNIDLLAIVLILFGTSYLTVFFLVLRIWLFFNHTNVFTWASILMMSIYILPAFPMVAGLTEGTSFGSFVGVLWILPSYVFGYPGVSTAIFLLVLMVEAWFTTRKKAGEHMA